MLISREKPFVFKPEEKQPVKKCGQCGRVFPATPVYWNKNKQAADGLHYYCRVCRAEYARAKRHDKRVIHSRNRVDWDKIKEGEVHEALNYSNE